LSQQLLDITPATEGNLLRGLDYSVAQQCMHCGLCLPTCPTYVETLQERSSPRGRIALMRAIADDKLEVSEAFAEEMYFCLGCLACQTACPAGVDYATLIETARAEVERQGILDSPKRNLIRSILLRRLFTSRRRLHALGRVLRFYQKSGLEKLVRGLGLLRLAPQRLRELEPLAPRMSAEFTHQRFARQYAQTNPGQPAYKVGLIAGCIADISFAHVNADMIEVLQANGCQVLLPEAQQCCGSLHGHNGEVELARQLARANLDAFDVDALDAILVNAGGCGSHIKHYDRLLAEDVEYAERARTWSRKAKDIAEWLDEIGVRAPEAPLADTSPASDSPLRVTYHESCHLKHGQKVSAAPRALLAVIPGIELVELTEADWCCGSAGIYNITQPEMSMQLLDRKMGHIEATQAVVIATGNPGCTVQIEHGLRQRGLSARVEHPVSLLAAAYRAESHTEGTP
jgi:glycolate oxidase iron-sulfur subunit